MTPSESGVTRLKVDILKCRWYLQVLECGNVKPGSKCSHSLLELLGKEAAFQIIWDLKSFNIIKSLKWHGVSIHILCYLKFRIKKKKRI